MQPETHKEEAIPQFCAETPPSSLGPSSCQVEQKTVETCIRQLHVSACFQENGHHAKDPK